MKICPLCSGQGKIIRKYDINYSTIKKLRAKGLTIRQIMKAKGIKSTSHVVYYLRHPSAPSEK